MKIRLAILVCSLTGFTPALVMGTPIAKWTFETGVQTPALVDANATASTFTLSSGTVGFVAGNSPTAATAITGSPWNVSDGVKWWEFTVTAKTGYLLDLTSLTFDDRASSTGPMYWSVTINGITAISSQTTHNTFYTDSINLSAFQDMLSADVKIFGFGGSGSGGTWRVDNVILNGLVCSVPDSIPAFAVLAGILGLLGTLRGTDGFNRLRLQRNG
jgi:hypothetical protein